mgnify:CR=1 FL=1
MMPDADVMRHDINCLGKALGSGQSPGWDVTAVAVTRLDGDHAAVLRHLETIRDGWVSLQSRVLVCVNGQWRAPLDGTAVSGGLGPAGGFVLAGEGRLPDGHSIAVRHLHGRSWQIVTIAEGSGEPALCLDQSTLSLLRFAPQYVTRTYWRLEGDGYRPFVSRFLRFSEITHA